MTASVDYLPIWKKGSTAEEWLLEIAAVARKHPERFAKMVLLHEETFANGNTTVDYYAKNLKTTELIGLLELGKVRVIESTTAK